MASKSKFVFAPALAVCGIAIVWAYVRAQDAPLDWNFPAPPAAPQPNAYDTYLKAERLIVQFNPPVDQIVDAQFSSPAQAATRYSLPRRQQWLKANTAGFQLLAQGLKEQCLPPDNALGGPYSFAGNAGMRELVRKVTIEANTFVLAGDYDSAFRSSLDAVQIGIDCSRRGRITDLLVTIGITPVPRPAMEKSLPHLTGQQAQTHARRLESLVNGSSAFPGIMTAEKWASLRLLKLGLEQKNWREMPGWTPPLTPKDTEVLHEKTAREVQADTVAVCDYYIAQSSRPYHPGLTAPPPEAADPVARLYGGGMLFDQTRCLYLDWLALGRMSVLRLYLQAHLKEHGRYPDNLSELSGLTAQTLTDPFTPDSSPLRYKKTPSGYLIWSLGPDSVDDGGIAHAKTLPKPGYKGDITRTQNGDSS